jgi:hypothetical protein
MSGQSSIQSRIAALTNAVKNPSHTRSEIRLPAPQPSRHVMALDETSQPTPSLCSDTEQDFHAAEDTAPNTPPPSAVETRHRPVLVQAHSHESLRDFESGRENGRSQRTSRSKPTEERAGPPDRLADPVPKSSVSRTMQPVGGNISRTASSSSRLGPSQKSSQSTLLAAPSAGFGIPSRVPVSPLPPGETPSKPKPPARAHNRSRARDIPSPIVQRQLSKQNGATRVTHHDEDEDPLALSSRDKPAAPILPDHSRRPRTTANRRLPDSLGDELFNRTLDEELISALDHESEVLIGVGTRSKERGFLRGGGAGGPPVLMGVGYVDGAIEDDLDLLDKRRRKRGSL